MSEALPDLNDSDAPAAVRTEMASLRGHLDVTVPRKRSLTPNLLIATWNIKDFGSLTERWEAGSNDSPKRDYRALWAIAEIISRFDIIAIQEVTGDLRALRTLIKTLGPTWRFLMTDVVRGSAGGGERLAFVFDSNRVDLSGLAGELVVPPEWLPEIGPNALQRQFARTPYAVSFRTEKTTVILVTLHILYGNNSQARIPELAAIGRWMADWATQVSRWHHNLIALGDFNIDRRDDDLWKAFTATGLQVPDQLHTVPRSIFANPERPLEKYYDQIAWFSEGSRALTDLTVQRAGSFDFVPLLYKDSQMPRSQVQYRISDHYPLWVEFL